MTDTNWNSFNPPPPPTLIPSSINLSSAVVSTGSIKGPWPTNEFPTTVSEDVTITYSKNPFNFIKVNATSSAITLTIHEIPVGTMIMLQIAGGLGVSITVLTGVVGGVPQTYTTSAPMAVAGTYLAVMFSDAVKYNILTNPTAV